MTYTADLSRPCLSRITAYLEVKIWLLPEHENLTTGNKKNIVEKKLLLSPLFHNIFDISLTSRVQLHIYLLNVAIRIIIFLNSANLKCRGTDISKYFRESLGIRDNESGLYSVCFVIVCSSFCLLSVPQDACTSHFLGIFVYIFDCVR